MTNPLINAAVVANSGQQLDTTKAVAAAVPPNSALHGHADNVIFINPPRVERTWFGLGGFKKEGVEAATKQMPQCYDNIFKAFSGTFKAFSGTTQKSHEIAIPAFNVSAGGIPPKQAAKIAVYKAVEFLEANPQAKVRFVCYNEDQAGKESYQQYWESINAVTNNGQDKELASRLKVTPGRIEDVEGVDAIVCPILGNYSVSDSGPIANTICKLAAQAKVAPQPQQTQAPKQPKPLPKASAFPPEMQATIKASQAKFKEDDAYLKEMEAEAEQKGKAGGAAAAAAAPKAAGKPQPGSAANDEWEMVNPPPQPPLNPDDELH